MPEQAHPVDPAARSRLARILFESDGYHETLGPWETTEDRSRWLAEADRTLRNAAKAGYAPSVPALPDEPPNGTVLRTAEGNVWIRDDDENFPGQGAWFTAGDKQQWGWVEVVADGADPSRRLVELPDPGELHDPKHGAVLERVGRAIELAGGWPINRARAALRALAEGAP